MPKLRMTALSTALALVVAAPAMAATYGYELSINDPIFNSASGDANVPDFQLENISDAGVQITDFSLTIGDTRFNFDFVRIENIVTDPGADLVATLNTVGTANDGVGDDLLDYDFVGFDAADVFQFEVDVDPDTGTPSQDFRNVLFPSAVVSVSFSNGETLSQNLDPASITPINYQFSQLVAPVPLPASMALYLGAGLLLGAGVKLKRRKPS